MSDREIDSQQRRISEALGRGDDAAGQAEFDPDACADCGHDIDQHADAECVVQGCTCSEFCTPTGPGRAAASPGAAAARGAAQTGVRGDVMGTTVTLEAARNAVGAAVVYQPRPGAPREDGVIRGVSATAVFVLYTWQRPDAHAQATPPETLTFVHAAEDSRVCANCSIPLAAEEYDALNCAECVESYAIPDWENER